MAAGSCTGSKQKAETDDNTAQKADSLALKIGVEQTMDCLEAFVAKDEGIFDSLGVDVRLCHYTSMLDCDEALMARRIHGAYTDEKRLEFINDRGKTKLSALEHTPMQWQLIANKNSRLLKASQLSDKMIAMTRHSATDYLSDRLIDSVKLKQDRAFRIQINDVDLRLKMLLNNEIDAAWLPEPQASEARRLGHNVLAQSGRKGEQLAVLAFTDAALADKRIKRQIDLYREGCRIAGKRIKEAGNRSSLINHYYNY